MRQLKPKGWKMKTNAGQLNLVTSTRAVSSSGLDEIPTVVVVEEYRETVSGRMCQ